MIVKWGNQFYQYTTKTTELEERLAAAEKGWDELSNTQDYDPGYLNDYGGGNVDWWFDYIRYEINRCNEYWRSRIDMREAGKGE